ncbi:MAG: Gfo/Idh/MocA family oxidoreductase [Caldilineaceae bacterium]
MQPDITVIATPNIFHKPMTLAALNAGSNVLCEKPLALTYADAKEMIETAAAKGLILNVGTHYRYTPTTCGQSPRGRRLPWARSTRHALSGSAVPASPGFGGWFTNKGLAGGGALLDIGIHALDRALYLMGYPKPVSVSGASFAKFGPRGVGLGGWGNETVDFHPQRQVRRGRSGLGFHPLRQRRGHAVPGLMAANMPEESCAQLFGTDGGMLVTNNELKLYKLMNGQEVNIDAVVPGGYPSSYGCLMEHHHGWTATTVRPS